MKTILHRFFIEGFKGMACGLFITQILGMALQQTGFLFHNETGQFLQNCGTLAISLTGAGIGIGVASRLGEHAFSCLSAAIAGMAVMNTDSGSPLGAFLAAFVAIEIARLLTGKSSFDLILAPLGGILGGCLCGFWIGIPMDLLMQKIGHWISFGTQQQPWLMGMLIAVFMGMACTLPFNAIALASILQLSGLAAGAATVGCCCNMIGFALAGYSDNGICGLLSIGLGTSKLQFPKILQHPAIWLPSILSSAILGPVSVLFAKMTNSTVGAGMGTSILMGPLMSYQVMAPHEEPAMIFCKIILLYFVFPGVLSLSIAKGMRKLNLIKPGDMSLDL